VQVFGFLGGVVVEARVDGLVEGVGLRHIGRDRRPALVLGEHLVVLLEVVGLGCVGVLGDRVGLGLELFRVAFRHVHQDRSSIGAVAGEPLVRMRGLGNDGPMKGDRVEVVVDVGGGATTTYDIVASKAGRRVETTTSRGVVEIAELTRTGQVVRTARFMQTRVVAIVEHPNEDGTEEGEPRSSRSGPRVPEGQDSLYL